MNTPPAPFPVPNKENLKLLLDKQGDQLRELQHAVHGASTISPEFKKTVQFLLVSTVLYFRCLSDWLDEREWPMQFVGWAARNLLELEVWTRFVLKSRKYADRFAKDWIVDGIGIGKSIESWGKAHGTGDMGLHQLVMTLTEMCTNQLQNETQFLRLRDYVAELGMQERYDQLNPLFSKLVHPTSWSVYWKQGVLDSTNMRLFIVTIGAQSSMNISTIIADHMKVRGLCPI